MERKEVRDITPKTWLGEILMEMDFMSREVDRYENRRTSEDT